MELREAYCNTEIDLLERETKKAIERIMITPGVQSPEYIPKFNAIMDNYRLRYAALQALKPTPYDNQTRTIHPQPGDDQDTRHI